MNISVQSALVPCYGRFTAHLPFEVLPLWTEKDRLMSRSVHLTCAGMRHLNGLVKPTVVSNGQNPRGPHRNSVASHWMGETCENLRRRTTQ